MIPFFRFLIGVVALALLGLGGFLSFEGKPSEAGLTYTAGLLCLIFFFLVKFKRFKGLGIEAETWEEKMDEAEKLVGTLRQLAEVTAGPLLMVAARTGRWSSALTRKQRVDLLERMGSVLRNAGVRGEAIEDAMEEVHRVNAIDIYAAVSEASNEVLRPLNRLADPPPDPTTAEAMNAHIQKWESLRCAQGMVPLPFKAKSLSELAHVAERVVEAVLTVPQLEPGPRDAYHADVRELMADLTYYAKHRQFRRPDVWLTDEDAD